MGNARRILASATFVATLAAADSGTGTTTRYWDCCKPSCAWNNLDSLGIKSSVITCDKNDKPLTDNTAQSGCTGGTAFMCSNQSPWAVSDTLAYGFAAVSAAKSACCQCYKLTFTSGAVKGKTMVVQSTNTGSDVGSTQFDLAMPGGGFGIYNGCSSEWGATSSVWGAQYGGSSTNTCGQFPAALKPGCNWRWDWFGGSDNPTVNWETVSCPSELTQKSGCTRVGDTPTTGGSGTTGGSSGSGSGSGSSSGGTSTTSSGVPYSTPPPPSSGSDSLSLSSQPYKLTSVSSGSTGGSSGGSTGSSTGSSGSSSGGSSGSPSGGSTGGSNGSSGSSSGGSTGGSSSGPSTGSSGNSTSSGSDGSSSGSSTGSTGDTSGSSSSGSTGGSSSGSSTGSSGGSPQQGSQGGQNGQSGQGNSGSQGQQGSQQPGQAQGGQNCTGAGSQSGSTGSSSPSGSSSGTGSGTSSGGSSGTSPNSPSGTPSGSPSGGRHHSRPGRFSGGNRG